MSKRIIHTPHAPAAIGPYSQAVAVTHPSLIFCSGQVALRPDGTFVDGDAAAQTRQAMNNLRAVLTAAGVGFEHVVKATIFLADLEDYAAVNKVYAEYFSIEPPARAAVQVARLPKDAKVEIEVIAAGPAAG